MPAGLVELPLATLLLLTRFLSTKGEAGSLCLLMLGEVEGDKSIGSSATQSPAQGADLSSGQIKFGQSRCKTEMLFVFLKFNYCTKNRQSK